MKINMRELFFKCKNKIEMLKEKFWEKSNREDKWLMALFILLVSLFASRFYNKLNIKDALLESNADNIWIFVFILFFFNYIN